MQRWPLAVLLLFALFVAGCDNPQRTIDTLRTQIAEFKVAPDEKKQAQIDANFVKLEQQITETRAKSATKADLLAREYAGLQGEYQAAKLARTINDAKNAIQGFGEALKEGAKSFGESLKSSGTDSN